MVYICICISTFKWTEKNQQMALFTEVYSNGVILNTVYFYNARQ